MRWTEEELAEFERKRSQNVTKQPTGGDNPRQAMQALGRLKTGEMNKTEAEYAEYLEALKHSGEILWWKFEGIKFRLADNTFYTPDFAVMMKGGEIEIRETKGFWTDDARVKIKVAAEHFPFKFKAVKKLPKKKGGGWEVEEF